MNKQTHIGLGAGLALLVLSVSALLLVPRWSAIGTARDEIEQFELELASPTAGPDAISTLESRLELVQTIGDNRITPIPDEPDLAGLMRRMSVMFDDAGLQAPQLTTGVPQEDVGAIAMPMTIIAEGDFVALVDAINAIESLPRLVRVRRVRLASDSDRRGAPIDRSGTIRADLQLDVFYAPFDPDEEPKR